MVIAAQSKTDLTVTPKFQTQQSNFDTDVLKPLQAVQAEEARKQAEAEAERLRQAEIARQADLNATASRMQPIGTFANNYTYLQCTWYVASRVQVPNSMGNATNWSYGLSSIGWRSGEPRRGAIGVSHNGYAGHLVLVEKVENGQALISEYNYVPYSYTERWVSASEYEWYFQ